MGLVGWADPPGDTEISIDPDATTERRELDDESWVDVTRGWLRGADDVYAALTERVAWRQGRVFRYERYLDEPRMGCWFGRDTPYPHPALTEAHRAIQHQYRVTFGGVGLAFYRDGRDSVAFHRDTDLRYCENTVIAILSLGARRPWLLQPRGQGPLREGCGGDDRSLTRQRAISSCSAAPARPTGSTRCRRCRDRCPAGRISAQWRWTSRTGKPEQQPSYRAPRHFSRPETRGRPSRCRAQVLAVR